MKRIKAFGCSLTAQHHWKYINSLVDLESYAICGGSNDMQLIQYVNEVHYNHILKDDIIVWQITNPQRKIVDIRNLPSTITATTDEHGHLSHEHGYLDVENIFDTTKRIEGLEYNVGAPTRRLPASSLIFTDVGLYSILAQLNGVKRDNNKLLVLFGWDGVFTSTDEKRLVMEFLKTKQIDFIEDSIYDWSLSQGHETTSTNHPCEDGYKAYAHDVLVPKLKDLDWI